MNTYISIYCFVFCCIIFVLVVRGSNYSHKESDLSVLSYNFLFSLLNFLDLTSLSLTVFSSIFGSLCCFQCGFSVLHKYIWDILKIFLFTWISNLIEHPVFDLATDRLLLHLDPSHVAQILKPRFNVLPYCQVSKNTLMKGNTGVSSSPYPSSTVSTILFQYFSFFSPTPRILFLVYYFSFSVCCTWISYSFFIFLDLSICFWFWNRALKYTLSLWVLPTQVSNSI